MPSCLLGPCVQMEARKSATGLLQAAEGMSQPGLTTRRACPDRAQGPALLASGPRRSAGRLSRADRQVAQAQRLQDRLSAAVQQALQSVPAAARPAQAVQGTVAAALLSAVLLTGEIGSLVRWRSARIAQLQLACLNVSGLFAAVSLNMMHLQLARRWPQTLARSAPASWATARCDLCLFVCCAGHESCCMCTMPCLQ